MTTTPNQNLHLSFALGSQQDNSDFRAPVSAAVIIDSLTNNFTLDLPTPGNEWMTFTWDFTATSASTALTIVGVTSAGGEYLGLDSISVLPLGPEV